MLVPEIAPAADKLYVFLSAGVSLREGQPTLECRGKERCRNKPCATRPALEICLPFVPLQTTLRPHPLESNF